MTHRRMYCFIAGLAVLFSGVASGRQSEEKIPIPLTDPNRPVLLKVGLIAGGIVVKGYAGKEVVVSARMKEEDDKDSNDKAAAGLKLIPNTSIGLTAEEEDNTVTISTGGRDGSHSVDLVIQVPASCSMKLSTVNDGDIEVADVNGDLEVNNTNGSITLKNISGSAVAQTVNGEVKVNFMKVSADKAMSFSTLNGDIDVTFPASLKATIQLKSEQGEIYSDFDVQMQKSPARVDKNERGKGKGSYRVTLDKAMRGTINGGGQEMQFNNFNGSIYIRKGG